MHNDTISVEQWRQGLYYIEEVKCTPPNPQAGSSSCDYKAPWFSQGIYPCYDDVQYYGRGPF